MKHTEKLGHLYVVQNTTNVLLPADWLFFCLAIAYVIYGLSVFFFLPAFFIRVDDVSRDPSDTSVCHHLPSKCLSSSFWYQGRISLKAFSTLPY